MTILLLDYLHLKSRFENIEIACPVLYLLPCPATDFDDQTVKVVARTAVQFYRSNARRCFQAVLHIRSGRTDRRTNQRVWIVQKVGLWNWTELAATFKKVADFVSRWKKTKIRFEINCSIQNSSLPRLATQTIPKLCSLASEHAHLVSHWKNFKFCYKRFLKNMFSNIATSKIKGTEKSPSFEFVRIAKSNYSHCQ